MFERYTEKARQVIFFTRYEALQYGSREMLPEHLLLALLHVDKERGEAISMFGELNIDEVQYAVKKKLVSRESKSESEIIPLSLETKEVLFDANQRAIELSDRHIRPKHLLSGILNHQKSIAKEILLECGYKDLGLN